MTGSSWDALNYKRFEHIEDSSESEGDCHPNIDLASWKRMKKRMRDEKGLPPRGAEVYDAYNYSSINKNKSSGTQEPTEKQLEEFFKRQKSKLDEYSMIQDDDQADKFIQENPLIVTNTGEACLITKAVDLSCEGEPAALLVPTVARRCLTIHNILVSAKDANIKPEVATKLFYERRTDERIMAMYNKEFEKQYTELLGLIKKRTKERLAEEEEAAKAKKDGIETMSPEEAEKKKAPLGPGGLDPTEVLNELPADMQEAFIKQDVDKLLEVVSKMDPNEAKRLMKRCVDAGLWVDNAEAEEKKGPGG